MTDIESKTIHILREAAAEFDRCLLLLDTEKAESIMLFLYKAFTPADIPFVLCAETESNSLKQLAQNYNCKIVFGDYKHILEEGSFDCCVTTTPLYPSLDPWVCGLPPNNLYNGFKNLGAVKYVYILHNTAKEYLNNFVEEYKTKNNEYSNFRMPVQYVIRPNNPTDSILHDFRGLGGLITAGSIKVGQKVAILPVLVETTIKEIWKADEQVFNAQKGESITLILQHDLDVSRGDIIVDFNNQPNVTSDLSAFTCNTTQELQVGKLYNIKHKTLTCKIKLTSIQENNFTFKSSKPFVWDTIKDEKHNEPFLIIDLADNNVIGTGFLMNN